MNQEQEIDYNKLNRIGGWLILLILRLLAAAVMAGISVYYSPKLGYERYIPLFLAIAILAVLLVFLILMKKRALRPLYFAFSLLCLLDYVLATDANGFVACMIVETGWNLYLHRSIRVKLVLGLITDPEQEEIPDS